MAAAALCVGIMWWISPGLRGDMAIFGQQLAGLSWAGVSANVWQLLTETIPEAVFGQDLAAVAAVPLSLCVVLSGLLLVRARLLWGVLLGLFAIQWFVFLPNERYALPLLPLVFIAGWRLLVGVAERLKEPFRGWVFGVVLVGVLGANWVGVGIEMRTQWSGDFYAVYREGKYAAAVEVGEWLGQHTPEKARVMTSLPVQPELSCLAWRRVLTGLDVEAVDAPRLYLVEPVDSTLDAAITQFEWRRGPVLFETPDPRSGDVWRVRQVLRQDELE